MSAATESSEMGANVPSNPAYRRTLRDIEPIRYDIQWRSKSDELADEVAAQSNERTRLVFVNRYFYPDISATSQMLHDLTTRLAQRGFEVHVVCSRQLYDNPAAALPEHEVVQGIHVHRIWTCTFGRTRLWGRACDYMSFYFSALAKLPRIVKRNDIVIAKTDPPLISVVAALVARLRGAKLINWIQDLFPEVASQLKESPLPRWVDASLGYLRDSSLRRAHRNVVLGKLMRERLLARGIAGQSIAVIENWADGSIVAPKARAENRFRESQGWASRFVVAYSGNLGRAHEFETMLGAAELLRDRPEVVFAMIGGGFGMVQMKDQVAKKKLKNVVFLPYQPRESLGESLAAADVHLVSLLPTLEGLIVPSKLYGIFAAGRPAIFIGDQHGDAADSISRARCGSVVECGNAQGLAFSILELAEDAKLAEDQGRRARQAFEANYTIEAAIGKWMTVLTDTASDVVAETQLDAQPIQVELR